MSEVLEVVEFTGGTRSQSRKNLLLLFSGESNTNITSNLFTFHEIGSRSYESFVRVITLPLLL